MEGGKVLRFRAEGISYNLRRQEDRSPGQPRSSRFAALRTKNWFADFRPMARPGGGAYTQIPTLQALARKKFNKNLMNIFKILKYI